MDAAAKLLGMSASDLRTALQSGQSLASDRLVERHQPEHPDRGDGHGHPAANPSVSADQATKVATAIATRTPPRSHRPGTATTQASRNGATSGTTITITTRRRGHERGVASCSG